LSAIQNIILYDGFMKLLNIFPFHGASYNVFIVTTIHINFNVSANGCHQVAHDFFFRNWKQTMNITFTNVFSWEKIAIHIWIQFYLVKTIYVGTKIVLLYNFSLILLCLLILTEHKHPCKFHVSFINKFHMIFGQFKSTWGKRRNNIKYG
jgi:hypothetical protein